MHRILLTGGSGLLGTELQKHIRCYAPDHMTLDITRHKFPEEKFDMVIHCAAYTDVDGAEINTEEVFNVNLGGTLNLLYEYGLTPFVYISSEYAHHPVNMYAASKYAGELAVKCLAEHYLIIRTLFKSRPWQWEMAWQDQWTQGDYVDTIAKLVARRILCWTKKESSVMYIGTERKTMYDLARKTKPDVQPVCMPEEAGIRRPKDYL